MLFSKIFAFIKRDFQEHLSFKSQIVLDLISIGAQCWVFFYIGKFIRQSGADFSTDYFSFLLLGTAVAGYQFSGLTSFSIAIQKEVGQGTLEAILLTPTHPLFVAFSAAIWSFLKTTMKLLGYLIIGFLFFDLRLVTGNMIGVFSGILILNAALWGIGLISASFVLILKRGDPVAYLLNGFTRLLSGIYFPVTILPGWIQVLTAGLPMTHGLALIRGLLLEGKEFHTLSHEFFILACFAAIFLPVGLFTFNQAVKRAKQEGSLTYTD